jgi:hemolysin III
MNVSDPKELAIKTTSSSTNTRNEIVSGVTHLLGAALSLVGLAVLVYLAAISERPWHLVAFSIFGAALVLLYSASTLYHLIPRDSKWKNIFRRIDHSMIFVLIAGTYTPICLIPLRGVLGWSLLAFIWGVAIAGVMMKALWLRIPNWVSTGIYVLMGWFGAITLLPLRDFLPAQGVVWLLAGGMAYTVGVIFYSLERFTPPIKWFGMHEIFHLFVMAGSFCHFWLMLRYILPIG